MQKVIIISCLIGSAIIILDQFGFFEALFMLLVAGAIPGTLYTISPSFMYGFLIVAISLVIIRLVGPALLDLFYIISERYSPKKKQQKLPKRRYEQI